MAAISIANELREHEPALYPTRIWNAGLDRRIIELPVEGDADAAQAVIAGLHLWNESLEASHERSQSIHTASGSYWHGIMHRMEGDYGNAKYWFHQAGSHPFLADMQQAALGLLTGASMEAVNATQLRGSLEHLAAERKWNPFAFVDTVQACVKRDQAESPAGKLLAALQRLEMQQLLAYCYRQCCGGTLFEPTE